MDVEENEVIQFVGEHDNMESENEIEGSDSSEAHEHGVTNVNDSFNAIKKKYVFKRGLVANKLQIHLSHLQKEADKKELSFLYFKSVTATVDKLLDELEQLNREFDNEAGQAKIGFDFALLKKDLNERTEMIENVKKKMLLFETSLGQEGSVRSEVSSNNITEGNNAIGEAIFKQLQFSHTPNLPTLTCDKFSGSETNKLAFKEFLSKFNSCITENKRLSPTAKMMYLMSYLSGYAHKLVSHLTLSDDSFEQAMSILKAEFLDTKSIVDESIRQLINTAPKYDDPEFQATKLYLNETKSMILELKSYGEEEFSIDKMCSHIVFNKLPFVIQKELINKLNTNFPEIDDIFSQTTDIIKRLNIGKMKNSSNKRSKHDHRDNKRLKSNNQNNSEKDGTGTLSNFNTQSTPSGSKANDNKKSGTGNNKAIIKMACKFCGGNDHYDSSCKNYPDYESRNKKCLELKMCFRCLSKNHVKKDCSDAQSKLNCYHCKSKGHVTAMCFRHYRKNSNSSNSNYQSTSANVCHSVRQMSSKNKHMLLPVITLEIAKENKSTNVSFLLDTGSQRTFISINVLKKLKLSSSEFPSTTHLINTFIGRQQKELRECNFDVTLPCGKKVPIDLLIDDGFEHINVTVPRIHEAVANIKSAFFKLADETLATTNEGPIELDGLLGNDVLQYISNIQKVACLNGAAWQIDQGIIPFGDINNFIELRDCELNCNTANCVSPVDPIEENEMELYVNFVMNPQKAYENIYEDFFPESDVEYGLERIFNLESIGISEEKQHSNDYDQQKIEEFSKNITYKNGHYYVKIPWHEGLIGEVPSNDQISLAVLERVLKKLEQQQLIEDYQNIFEQWEQDGIIERFHASPEDYHKYKWIPHRPVFKDEITTTTKIRPVFNCSLKVRNKPSLNESAYPGVNLMSELLNLLLYFRSNDYVMLADVKKAFLMIRLAEEVDQNRFCFFMYVNGELVCYRYKTLLFGFTASPFVLNYLIKHHADKYEDDECSHYLKHNFYVDNLIITGNSPKKLAHVYEVAIERMKQGGFTLRSWLSNNTELNRRFAREGNGVEHDCDLEKILGYKFSYENDTMHVAKSVLNGAANTKRSILSNISKVYEPLGLCSPVIVRCKKLMRAIWSKNDCGWDNVVDDEVKAEWLKLCSDLMKLSELAFPRKGINEDEPAELYIFCDASKQAYGFAVYVVQKNRSMLIFAKTKIAPMKSQSVPALELLAAFLAIKCIPSLLDTFIDVRFGNIVIAVDAQIVLTWLVSKTNKITNVFASNRLKDIKSMTADLQEKYGVEICYRYVNTEINPADLLTRGLSFDEFENEFSSWIHGPEWLRKIPVVWPKHDLNCLSEENKKIVQATQVEPIDTILPITKFSSLHKLIKITALVFKFLFKLKGSKDDPVRAARLYWIREMQKKCFVGEIKFLEGSVTNRIPTLVNQLNLFIDDDNIVRCKGRIDKAVKVSDDVKNPILLGKESFLTELIIMDAHEKCKHLGVQTTVNKIRMYGLWIPKARVTVRNILLKCVTCRKFQNLAFAYPKLTNLPKHRVNLVRAFAHIGVDFTGHLFVKRTDGSRTKMYILLFTCICVRAIHIELVPDMSTQSFILAFVRFTNINGIPSHLYSDNAKSFVAGGNLLEKAFASNEFINKLREFNIKHVRIPAYSAWVGGVWERLIGTVKKCLYKTIGRATLSYFELLTVLSDIQVAVNSRPLTYRCADDSGLEIITPNSFIRPQVNEMLFIKSNDPHIWEQGIPNRDQLIETLDSRNELVSKFVTIWYENYLLSLREQYKNLHENQWENKIKVDDVVLVKIPNKPRPFWPLGRVIELNCSDDGKTRSVVIKRGDGLEQIHSIKHLYPIELELTHEGTSLSDFKNVGKEKTVPQVERNNMPEVQKRRPHRLAAEKCVEALSQNKELFY